MNRKEKHKHAQTVGATKLQYINNSNIPTQKPATSKAMS